MRIGEMTDVDRRANSDQTTHLTPGFWFLLAALAATGAKLLVAWNTIGPMTPSFFLFGRELVSRSRNVSPGHSLQSSAAGCLLPGAIYDLSNLYFFTHNNITFFFSVPGYAGLVSSLSFEIGRRNRRSSPSVLAAPSFCA